VVKVLENYLETFLSLVIAACVTIIIGLCGIKLILSRVK
jgi:hypothetical protein